MCLIRHSESDAVYAHKRYIKEKEELFGKDRKIAIEYDKWLDNKLYLLSKCGISRAIIDYPKIFEKLSGTTDLYSIRNNKSTGNPRSLFFTIIEEEGEESYILLTAFKEKRKSDYKKAIDVAEQRQKEIIEKLNL